MEIHAPRVGGDGICSGWTERPWNFNPRPPCGGRPVRSDLMPFTKLFQSTPPVWGATMLRPCHLCTPPFQSTPPVWGATVSRCAHGTVPWISIHAPRVGGDKTPLNVFTGKAQISIHAPRVGGDLHLFHTTSTIFNFNPRPPCGGRLSPFRKNFLPDQFQSTPPVWGATVLSANAWKTPMRFQSTPPVWGATSRSQGNKGYAQHFNPRPPCGGRLRWYLSQVTTWRFQSTPPCGGRQKRVIVM